MATKTDSRMEEVMEISSETEGSSYSASDSDSDAAETDPDYDILEETYGKLSNLSIDKKAKSRVVQGENRRVESDTSPEELEMSDSGLDEKDEEKFEKVQKMIDAGELEKLKVLECKLYLRKSGLRLTGKKDMLIQRIREHLEIINGGGERKYPHSSFVLNCKGDACTGDVVLFEQNVYEMFSIASRSATGPPCGKRTVAGRIVKESYGAAKQQHTFTIEVLWSKGEKPLPPLHPLLIKGRNLYRLKTLRQRWEDEGKRQKILMEKHSRGDVARANREVRIQEKEKRKINRENRVSKNEPSRNHSQSHPVMTKSKYQHEGSAISIDEAKPKSFFDHGENVTTKPHQQRIYHMPIDEAKPKSFFDHGENVTTKPHQQRIYHMPNHHALKRSENGWILSDIHHHHTRGSEYSEKNYSHDTIHSREKRIITETNRSANCRIPYENYYYHARDAEFNEKYYYHSRDAEYSEKYYYHNNHSIEARITTETNRYPERHELLRKPLTSANHLFPPLTLNREPQKHKKLCRYYAQGPGRCHYGDNCKFLHDFREHR